MQQALSLTHFPFTFSSLPRTRPYSLFHLVCTPSAHFLTNFSVHLLFHSLALSTSVLFSFPLVSQNAISILATIVDLHTDSFVLCPLCHLLQLLKIASNFFASLLESFVLLHSYELVFMWPIHFT